MAFVSAVAGSTVTNFNAWPRQHSSPGRHHFLRESGNASPDGYGGRIVFETSCVCVSQVRSISKTEMPRHAHSEKTLGPGSATLFSRRRRETLVAGGCG